MTPEEFAETMTEEDLHLLIERARERFGWVTAVFERDTADWFWRECLDDDTPHPFHVEDHVPDEVWEWMRTEESQKAFERAIESADEELQRAVGKHYHRYIERMHTDWYEATEK